MREENRQGKKPLPDDKTRIPFKAVLRLSIGRLQSLPCRVQSLLCRVQACVCDQLSDALPAAEPVQAALPSSVETRGKADRRAEP